jgi:DNA-directed DNA polymerase III PolC
MGYASYFLVVHDIVEEATRRGIPTLGRGSVANSTVAYALGITHVDPVAHHLFFERFLNPERLDPPDIDLDLPWNKREEMCRYLVERYGEDHVAMIGAFGTMKTRSLFREVGRALGLPPDSLNQMAKHLPGGSLGGLDAAIQADHPVYRDIPLKKAPWGQVLGLARRLSGVPHHFAIHPCGIAVSGVPIRKVLPVVPSPSDWPTTDADMGPAEELGLIKIDLLGNRSMSALTTSLDALGLRDKSNPEGGLEPETAINDPSTADLLAKGDTVGCFYIESPSMRSIMKRLECRDYETLVAASSIIRPGVNQGGLMDAFVRRHRGEEADSYPDERLIPFLKETHGILVYQEQVIQTAATVAGMSLGEADQLRRAMGKKRHHPAEAMSHYRQQFIGGALKGGMSGPKADALWQQIESFAGYAFCKAHSASFARMSYQMAWLKTHHPALFFASILTNQGGFYHPQVYVDEARRGDIHLLPPCVVHGSWETEAVDELTIRIGLQYVRNLGRETAHNIMERRPYTNWGDLLARVRPDREVAAMLVQSGATDGLGSPVTGSGRRERLWQTEMELGTDHGPVTPERDLFAGVDDPETVPVLSGRDETTEAIIKRELASMDLSLADHPLRLFRAQLLPQRHTITPARRLSDVSEGQVVTCVGLPVARKSLATKKGEPMAFLTLSDRTGLIETVLFPKVIRQLGPALRHQAPWVVTGTMQDGCVVVARAQVQT